MIRLVLLVLLAHVSHALAPTELPEQIIAPAYAEVNCGNSKWYTGVAYRFPGDPVYREQRLAPQALGHDTERRSSRYIGDRARRSVGQCLFT